MSGNRTALVLLVHGSRDPAWMDPFRELARRVEEAAPGVDVAIACLQFCGPTLAEVLCALSGRGVERVTVAPVFISALGHVLKDVPGEVDKARASCPGLAVAVSPALGELESVRRAFVEGLRGMVMG